MAAGPPPPRRWRDLARVVGPGIVVAGTGVGAGDLVAAAKAGAVLGLPVLWAALVGAVLKYVLTEGVARWQLATGTTLLHGWVRRLGWPVRVYVMVYLTVWSFVVAAALMSACGLAAHALVPALSVATWAMLHAVAALALVWFEGYAVVERLMKWAIGAMVVAIIGSAALRPPALGPFLSGLMLPSIPAGGALLTAGVVGGVGGTVTLLSYGYWMKEKRWVGSGWLRAVRVDLAVAYGLTGVFGVALTALGATVLRPAGIAVEGSNAAVQLATVLGETFGRTGEALFLVGFWAAVTTSIVGVWQGVPYLFAHLAALWRGGGDEAVSTRGGLYRGWLLFLTFPPMLLLLLGRPVWLVVAYAALGSLFMPFLAGTLLVLNRRRGPLGHGGNGPVTMALLALCLVLFAVLAVSELV